MTPRDVDYSAMEVGTRVRLPKGEIAVCPICGKPGLRGVYSFRRGRYRIGYTHTAVHDAAGFAPLMIDGCSIAASKLSELPASERAGPRGPEPDPARRYRRRGG